MQRWDGNAIIVVFFVFGAWQGWHKVRSRKGPSFFFSFYYILRSLVAEQRANRVTSRRGMWPDAGIACAQPRCGRNLSLSAWQLSWCSRFFVRWLDLHQIVIARALSSVVMQSELDIWKKVSLGQSWKGKNACRENGSKLGLNMFCFSGIVITYACAVLGRAFAFP